MENNTPRPVDLPVSGATAIPSDVSITKIQIPLTVTVAALLAILGGVVSFSVTWGKTSDHVANAHVHIDESKAIEGGGVAYRKDVESAKSALDDRISQEAKRTRKLLRKMSFDCRKVAGDGFTCRVSDLPDDGE